MSNKEVMQQALEALETLMLERGSIYETAITALREALAQPEQEPVKLHEAVISAWSLREVYFDEDGEPSMHRSPPAAQPEQEPVAFYHPHKGFYWAKPTHIAAPTVVDVPPVPLYVKWKAAQRPWQGLIDEEVQFYIKKHSKLVNAGYDKATDTNLVAKTFDSTGFYKEVSAVLKERNT